MTAASAARWTAIVIAAAAVIDPAIEREMAVRAEVALIAAPDAEDYAGRIAARLDDEADVVRDWSPTATATVFAGRTLPDLASQVAGPIVIAPPALTGAARVVEVRAPQRASMRAEVPVEVIVDVPSDAGTVSVTLDHGPARVDRVALDAAGRQTVRLAFLPVRTGPAVLRASVRDADDLPVAAADVAVLVEDTPWRVLFHDARPSWMSTFVRRALEGDPRFDVAARVGTSLEIGVRIGTGPVRLSGWTTFDDFDVVVVGAPEALTAAEVSTLESFARRRGGTLVLPLDRLARGPHDRLLGVAAWETLASPAPVLVTPRGGLDGLQTAELGWPATLPAGAEVLARAAAPDAPGAAVSWRVPAGAGAVVVSGMLDAWRYRADEGDGFGRFWRATIAASAARAMPPVTIAPAIQLANPGERVAFDVTVRNAALSDAGTAVVTLRAAIDEAGGVTPLPMWPVGPPGLLRVPLVAPVEPGTYELTITSGDASVRAVVVVAGDVARPNPDESGLAAAWAASRGGRTAAAGDASAVAAAVRAVTNAPVRHSLWRPMRSPWWIAPFTLLLGAEWWWRRRHGRP